MTRALRRVIFIDVDGTLIINGKPNGKIVDFCRRKKAQGFQLVLWSAAGERHAIEAAEQCGLANVFSHILSKPGYIVDDKAWTWIRFVCRLIPR